MQKNCIVCGKTINVKPSRFDRTKYCSKDCAKRGWSGQRRSAGTEFTSGPRPERRAPVGTIKARQRTREKSPRQWIKVAEPNKWILYAVYLWERAYGSIPQGLILHHLDHNTMNDSLSNLALVTRSLHISLHRYEFEERRIENLVAVLRKT